MTTPKEQAARLRAIADELDPPPVEKTPWEMFKDEMRRLGWLDDSDPNGFAIRSVKASLEFAGLELVKVTK